MDILNLRPANSILYKYSFRLSLNKATSICVKSKFNGSLLTIGLEISMFTNVFGFRNSESCLCQTLSVGESSIIIGCFEESLSSRIIVKSVGMKGLGSGRMKFSFNWQSFHF